MKEAICKNADDLFFLSIIHLKQIKPSLLLFIQQNQH